MQDTIGVDLLSDIDTKGAEILIVTPGSIADKAGIKYRDVVKEYAGKPIASADDLKAAVANTASGAKVPVKLHRNQAEVTVEAQF